MEIACNNNAAIGFYQEKSIRKGFKPEMSLVIGKECNTVSNKEEVLQGGLNVMKSTLNCKMNIQ
jgi:hypothetical protein